MEVGIGVFVGVDITVGVGISIGVSKGFWSGFRGLIVGKGLKPDNAGKGINLSRLGRFGIAGNVKLKA